MLKSISNALSPITGAYRSWFHTRNIIIMSEHKVKHIPINGHVQFVTSILFTVGFCWAAYSTGGYFAARATVKAQNVTIRSVASERVETNFSSVLKPIVATSGRSKPKQSGYTLSDPLLAISGPDPKALYNHISKLEKEVNELKTSNEAIIAHVKQKTASNIDALESVIRQTGLSSDELKKVAARNFKPTKKAEGGPFIPDDLAGLSPSDAREIDANLDKLSLLNKIVGVLPLGRPLRGGEEQSSFGRRIDPFTGRFAFHSGLDFSGASGSKIYATGTGKVVAAGRDGAYGNAVDIDHGFGIVTRYGHMSQILVEKGQPVAFGQAIGIQGSTGRSTGDHVHYEVRYHDQPMNPKNFVNAMRYVTQN